MGKLNFTHRQRARALRKIEGTQESGLVVGVGKERTSWYYVNNEKTLKINAGQIHRGDMTPGAAKALLRELKLKSDDFNRLVKCPMSANEYHALVLTLRSQGVI